MIIGFGKYRGYSVDEVHDIDRDYLFWMLNKCEAASPELIKEIKDYFTVDTDLMPDQSLAADQITEKLLESDDNRCYRLQGGAGYGKSYVVTEIAQRARDMGYQVLGIANSYVATQVLAQSLDPIGVESKTIARAFQLTPNKESYKESYGPGPYTPSASLEIAAPNRLLIVDEYSMVSDMIVKLTYDAMLADPENNSKLLVVGDQHQLPSPEQDTICQFNEIEPHSELYIPKRFAQDSPLHVVEKSVRQHPYQLAEILSANDNGESIIQTNTMGGLIRRMIADLSEYPDQSASMLFFKRDPMVKANKLIREIIYGPTADEIEADEQLRVMRTTFYPVTFDSERGKWEYDRYYSGTFLKASKVWQETTTVHFENIGLKTILEPVSVCTWKIKSATTGIEVPVIFSKTEHQADPNHYGGKEFNAALSHVVDICKEIGSWKPYHHFRSHFVQIAYSYATTVHRSQGASVDRVYFHSRSILQGGPSLAPKLAYVAATRAKKQLSFCN